MAAQRRSPRELARCTEDLVRAATPDADPRALQATVEETLAAFDAAGPGARDDATRAIGRALGRAKGRGAVVLALTLGALVEGGASPELAWPPIARGLHDLLEAATTFASAAFQHATTEAAARAAIRAAEQRHPEAAAAFHALPSRCLAAVACLTRSKAVRTKARADQALFTAAAPLSEVAPEVGVMLQAMRMLDDASILVIAPEHAVGWHVVVDGMPSNLELSLLLADAVVASAKRSPGPALPFERIDPKVVAIVKNGAAPKRPPVVKLPFQLVAWTAVAPDGSLAATAEDRISVDDAPADIPALGEQRVVLVDALAEPLAVTVEPTFEAARPKLEVLEALSPGEVVRVMVALAREAATRPTKARRTKQRSKSR